MKRLSIGTRILVSIGSLAMGYLLFLTLVQWTGSAMVKHMNIAAADLFPAALATQDAHEGFQKMTRAYADAVLMQDPKSLDVAAKEADKVGALLHTIESKTSKLPELKEQIEPLTAQFSSTDAKSRAFYRKILSGQVDVESAATNRAIVLDNLKLDKMFGDFNDTISKKSVQTELSAVSLTIRRQRLLTAALFLFAAIFAVYTTRSLRAQISVPVRRTVGVLQQLAEGDLTVSLKFRSGDEMQGMADAFNVAMERIRDMIVQAGEGARRASSSSAHLAEAATVIAEGTQHQAENLQQTSARLDQLALTVRQNAEDASQAHALASSSGKIEAGKPPIPNAVDAMAEIEKASARIAGIVKTIDEIAFQTNLLAVNAAVEAAHAGDEGLGFAVVAQEVRRLSQRSAQAANEITVLIQESLDKVATGTRLVRQVTDLVNRIASASAQQTVGIGEVHAAMKRMDGVAQSNSTQTDQLSATALELARQSTQLLELIGTFQVAKPDGKATESQDGTATRTQDSRFGIVPVFST